MGCPAWAVVGMRWTEEEDEILLAYRYEGSEAISQRLWDELGVVRSVRSVEMRAHRLGVSLAVRSVCPGCGATGVKINRTTGLCRKCSERQHLEEELAFHEILEAERAEAEADSEEIDELHRRREKARQANSRMCRKYGFKGRRERGKGGS